MNCAKVSNNISHMKLSISFILLGLSLSLPANAAIYKCQAANGQTTYSSKKCAKTAEIFTPTASPQIDVDSSSENTQSKPSVDIYITSWCPYCKKAMAFLRSKNIAFNSYDIEKDSRAKAKKHQLDPGYSGVPLTVINGQLLKGFSKGRFERALKKK